MSYLIFILSILLGVLGIILVNIFSSKAQQVRESLVVKRNQADSITNITEIEDLLSKLDDKNLLDDYKFDFLLTLFQEFEIKTKLELNENSKKYNELIEKMNEISLNINNAKETDKSNSNNSSSYQNYGELESAF